MESKLPKIPREPGKKKKPLKKEEKSWFVQQVIGVVLFFVSISLIYSLFNNGEKTEEVTLGELARSVEAGEVVKIVVAGQKLEATFVENDENGESILKFSKKESESSLSEQLEALRVTDLAIANVDIEVKNESGVGYWLLNILPIAIPLLFIVLFIWFLSRQVKGAGMQAFSFGQSRARVMDPSKQNITFADVAGNKEAKEELLEIVDFLKFPKKFLDIGAEIPKGVLLMGAPGTGKTLMARAVAGEARVPFFHLSGSEFVEMFVGVGASRVRDLFQTAKKSSPAIIFIDEIDAVGRSRGVGIGGGNDEREQTLNQILVEMDGFEPTEKLIVMAATNRPDVLDSALLRPGRFDRRVMIDLPDRKDREAILAIHAKKKPLAEDVNLQVIATRTSGFSGADLASLMNEAAILAAREDRKKVSQYDLVRSIDKVMIGPERKSHLHTEHERKVVAYHEAGHAIVATALDDADPVHKVSIVARGGAGGYTLYLPFEERKLISRNQFIAQIAMSLGGYAAENIIFGDVTTGASNDIQVSTRTARSMVTRYGMSDQLGPVALESGRGATMFGEGMASKEHSDRVESLIDSEVQRIMEEGLATAKQSLEKHKDALDALAQELMDIETIEQNEFNTLIKRFGLKPKEQKSEV